MKKILIVFVFLNFNLCFAQSFSAVKVYIANPYVERVRVIKTQMYNMDYVRSHYASFVLSMEQNYINALVGGIVGAVGGGFGGNLLGDKAGRTIYNNF